MNTRTTGIPIFVFQDAKSGESRCINGLHVQTFIANPHGEGTLITFASGDTVVVADGFEAVVDTFMADRVDG